MSQFLTFTVSLEFSDGQVNVEHVKQALIDALAIAQAEGFITPDTADHPAFISAGVVAKGYAPHDDEEFA